VTTQALTLLQEKNLSHFDPQIRSETLNQLALALQAGDIDCPPPRSVANMHCHTFFSFNAYGYSPTALAWLAKKNGYKLMGIVDFDVLDGVDEFLDACELLGVAASTGIETRNFLPEFADVEINSPGEPGVYYNMGIGFSTGNVPPQAQSILTDLKQRSTRRNHAIVERVNDYLFPIQVDYEKDVVPFTPDNNPTERHIVLAYLKAVERETQDSKEYWGKKLGLTDSQKANESQDSAQLQNLIRSKLMKRGGIGYIQPNPDSFPTVDQFYELALLCGALPCATWLDGLSKGEQVFSEILELLISKGAAALNLVPDRNWNIQDKQLQALKLQNLYDVVELAGKMDLPINIGTEMNTYGNKLIDDFDVPELAPVRNAFLDGSYFIYGHTILQRALGLGYQSEWAQSHFPSRKERNQFYTKAGYAIPPGKSSIQKLRDQDHQMLPNDLLAIFKEGKQ
jgi:hypothetical protein